MNKNRETTSGKYDRNEPEPGPGVLTNPAVKGIIIDHEVFKGVFYANVYI